MTYTEDLKRLHQLRIEALENRVEELEAKVQVLEFALSQSLNQ
jgi:hypothetical protein